MEKITCILNMAQLQNALIYLSHKEAMGVIQQLYTVTNDGVSHLPSRVTLRGVNDRMWFDVFEIELKRIFQKYENHYDLNIPTPVTFDVFEEPAEEIYNGPKRQSLGISVLKGTDGFDR